jgi:dephospho-CoA kinase|tara:strand:+ start:281 stop:877 length:597 start_codon:yes stop_codon:yes gene_type:complete
MIIGLTGGIGSGKSVVGNFFTELGIDVIDADLISRNILDTNKKARKLFVKSFGNEFIDKKGNVNREQLRTSIFDDKEKKMSLESIIHPLVREEIINFTEQSKSIYKIVMVPLIYETQSSNFYEKIIVIDCDEQEQIERASKRDGKSKENILSIIKTQASRNERNSIADFIILNDSSIEDLRLKVIQVHQKLLGINIDA